MSLRSPIVRHATLAAAGTATITFGVAAAQYGTVHIINLGPGNVAVKFDAVPAVAPADNQFTLAPGGFYNTDVVVFGTIGLRDAGAGCEVQAIAYIAAGGDIR